MNAIGCIVLLSSVVTPLVFNTIGCGYGWNDGVVEEAAPMSESKDPDWWVNSGAYFFKKEGIGFPNMGKLPEDNRWRRLYAMSNPQDTEEGYRPQNIARFVTRKKWKDYSQEIYFRIVSINESRSENRNASNGVLLFNRYVDGNNLYYVGLRVDGRPVIKKKIEGVYYTLAYPPAVFEGVYDPGRNSNLIPLHTWIGLRSYVVNEENNSVRIRLFIDVDGNGQWKLVASVLDDGTSWGLPFAEEGYLGIRTDFMDVELKSYVVIRLNN